MGLPRLQDFLPPDTGPDQKPVERDTADLGRWLESASEEHGKALISTKQSAGSLRTALDRFIDELENRPGLTEEDVKEVVADLTSQRKRQELNLQYLIEIMRSLSLLLQSPSHHPLNQQLQALLEVVDRRSSAQKEIAVIFDLGVHRLLVLRDKLLLLEAEEMSSPSFWGDNEL